MIKDFFRLALRNIRHRGIRSWLTMLGIFIGIAAVVALISLGQALQTSISSQFATLGPDKLLIQNAETGFGPPGSTAIKKLNENDLKIIQSIKNIDSAVPRLVRVIKVEYNNEVSFQFAVSIPMDNEQINEIYESNNMEAETGRTLRFDDRKEIILGSDFGKGNFMGKKIEVGTNLIIQDDKFEVVGLLKETGTFQVNAAVFLMEDDMKEILNIGDEIDLIAVKVTDKKFTEEVAEEIKRKLRDDRNLKTGEEDFSVETPAQSIASINTILRMVNLVVVGIAAISLIIGGIGIANTMYASIIERRKEIGIMKAIGARNSDVLKIFLIESGLLGLVGGIVGSIIGLAFAFIVSGVAKAVLPAISLTIQISWPVILGSIAFSFVIGVISGTVPAWQASRLKPVEALRS